jgi:cytochrome c553
MKTLAALLFLALLAVPMGVLAQVDVTSCGACHGVNGEGNAVMAAPRLAGQPAAYLQRQLEAYGNGRRANGVMTPIAQALTPDQRRLMAAHYATLDAAARPAAKATGPERGRLLARVGDEKVQIQACNNCHGPDGVGAPPVNPYLAGQIPKYLVAALQAFKNGSRDTDPSRQMPDISQRLSAADMNAVAQYFASQPPPSPRLLEGRAPRVVGPPAAAGAPATQPPAGVGVEQGAPTTGPTQSPGGAPQPPKR